MFSIINSYIRHAHCKHQTAGVSVPDRGVMEGEILTVGQSFRRALFAASMIAVATATTGAQAADAPQALTAVETLYAELAKLPAAERTKRIEDGARKEGKLSFVHSWRGQLGQRHVDLFLKRYPFVTIDISDIGSQDAAERLVAEETAGRHLTDIVSLAVGDMGDILGLIARYPTPATARIFDQYKDFIDAENRWVPFYWTEHGLSYNSAILTPDKAPKGWDDLCKPEYKGQISFDPLETRFLIGLSTMMGEQKLEAWLKCIGQNKPIIQRGHTQRLQLMLAGDHWIQGDNYLYQGMLMKAKDPSVPFAPVFSAPSPANAGVMVINKHTPHPYAAALLADWTLSEESQEYTAKQYRGPVAAKHPYMPEDAKIVVFGLADAALVDRLQGYWTKYIGSGAQ
jgi:ABC-type Fe3+ transport system, periplasmic component